MSCSVWMRSISIHTSPKGGDGEFMVTLSHRPYFNPHLPEGR